MPVLPFVTLLENYEFIILWLIRVAKLAEEDGKRKDEIRSANHDHVKDIC